MGIWGEFIVDVSFDTVTLADHIKSGFEFKYVNGRDTKFATSFINNGLFVGFMNGVIETPEDPKCAVHGNCRGTVPTGDNSTGLFAPQVTIFFYSCFIAGSK